MARWPSHGSDDRARALIARGFFNFAAFQYSAAHSVLEVSAADHGACSASNPLRSHRDQSTTIPLTKPGTRYFICGAAGHCAAGMKLAVTISGGDSAPATAATSGPTMRSTNATPAAGSTAAATESDSSAAAATASGARLATGLLLGAVGLAGLMG